MNIQLITPDSPGCFGVLCEDHGQCARYQAVDGAPAHLPRIGTCDDHGDGQRPLFIKIKEVAGKR